MWLRTLQATLSGLSSSLHRGVVPKGLLPCRAQGCVSAKDLELATESMLGNSS